MVSRFEIAPTGRSRCRGCGEPIAKGERRFGDEFANAFADDRPTTHWYHPWCAAFRRPDALLPVLLAAGPPTPDDRRLHDAARRGLGWRRLPRLDGAERAVSGRASCRACRQRIEHGSWRLRLVFHDEGRFEPGGFVHAGCAAGYFGVAGDGVAGRSVAADAAESGPPDADELLERAARFTPGLADDDRADLLRALVDAR